MENVVKWLKEASNNPAGYNDKLYKEGVELANQHIKNVALLRSFKPKVVTPLRRKLLFNALMRLAKLNEKTLEKKSGLTSETAKAKAARLQAAAEAKAKAAAASAKAATTKAVKKMGNGKKPTPKPTPKADSQE